jgi:hypothetical protein
MDWNLSGIRARRLRPGILFLLGSNLPHLWINDAGCQYAEACVVQFKAEILGDFLLLLPELARIRLLMESATRGVVFGKGLSKNRGQMKTELHTNIQRSQ